jgi:hypothetical protein
MQGRQTGSQASLGAGAENRQLVEAKEQLVVEPETSVDGKGHDDSGRSQSIGTEVTEPWSPFSPTASVGSRSRNSSITHSVPLRQPSGPSETLNARPSLENLGRSYKDRIQIALCPQGQHVGYLFPDCIIVCELDTSRHKISSSIFVELDSNVRWENLQLAGHYLVTWGSGCSQSAERSVSYIVKQNTRSRDNTN